MAGYPKSGNTWIRLVYYNWINVVNGGASETLTYSQLNRANPNAHFPEGLAGGFIEPRGIDHRGFPLLVHGHAEWDRQVSSLARTLYVYRNPLDSLIGLWYATQAFPVDVPHCQPIDAFVTQRLPDWVAHHTANAATADVAIRYEELVGDDLGTFRIAFGALGLNVATETLDRAVAMSRFDRVRRMEDAAGEWHGHRADPQHRARFGLSPWKSGRHIRFARSGLIGQWRTELRRDTIVSAAQVLKAARLDADVVVAPLMNQVERP
jgi:hypothetical protein